MNTLNTFKTYLMFILNIFKIYLTDLNAICTNFQQHVSKFYLNIYNLKSNFRTLPDNQATGPTSFACSKAPRSFEHLARPYPRPYTVTCH